MTSDSDAVLLTVKEVAALLKPRGVAAKKTILRVHFVPVLGDKSLDVEEAERARCGIKRIYREVRAGRLQTAYIGGRRELRLLSEWIDAWLLEWPQPAEAFNLFRGLDRRRA